MIRKWTGVVFADSGAAESKARFHVKPMEYEGLPSSTIEAQVKVKPTKALIRIETTTTSYKECVAWLVGLMRASPLKRIHTRGQLWKMAQEKWPETLSERSFLAARAEAIRTSGASIWAAAGVSKKSARRKSTR
jgi:hypothetical protein